MVGVRMGSTRRSLSGQLRQINQQLSAQISQMHQELVEMRQLNRQMGQLNGQMDQLKGQMMQLQYKMMQLQAQLDQGGRAVTGLQLQVNQMNDDLRQLIELWNEKFAQVQDQLGTMDYCFATVDNSFANFAIELTVINSKLDKLLDHVLDQICKGQVGADETLVRLAVLRLDVLWARPGPSVDNIALESCFHAP